MSTEEEISSSTSSTYDWLSANPLATSCGSAISCFYSQSKNYNRLTSWTFGSVESVLGYASEKARPYVDVVTDRFEKPMEAVDGYIAEELKKLEVKYPIISRPPNEIATESKKAVSSAFQSGQECLGNTRAGAFLGYGVDVTLDMTEGLVDKVLPPPLPDVEEEGEEVQEPPVKEEKPVSAKKNSWFGLRRRKKQVKEEDPVVEDSLTIEPVVSRSGRIRNISYAVYYRSLTKVQSLQQEVYIHLQRLRTSLNLLQYAQSISEGVGKQKQNVAQALRDADAKIREYFSQKSQSKSNEEFAAWLSDGENDEDINWLLRSNNQKDIFHAAFDYAKSLSEQTLERFRSLSGVTSYLPSWLHDGINNAVQQVQDVYSTLMINNVPAELPSFLLTQIVEIVEAQLVFCKKLGGHITSALKSRYGYTCDGDNDDHSETSSQGVSEVRLDADEEDEEDSPEDN